MVEHLGVPYGELNKFLMNAARQGQVVRVNDKAMGNLLRSKYGNRVIDHSSSISEPLSMGQRHFEA